MIEILYHGGIDKEIVAFERRFRTIRSGLAAFERLCKAQFDPISPRQVIAPAKLHRVLENGVWTLWKIELIVPNSGLRPNQWPRMWFAVRGSMIAFLCLVSHMDNYDNETLNRVARSRVDDVF